MKFGVYLTNQHYLDKDLVSALDEQIAMVKLARDKGWDSLFTGHHYLNEGNNHALQWVPYLARMQADAGHMAVGIGILLLPLHNPVYVAETAASMDVICRGNFILGLGLGYRQMEFDAFAVPMKQRARRFEQHLALIKRLWTEESVSYEDESCKLVNVRMNLRPVQKPHMPIWIAANNDAAVKRAAKLGDAWMIPPHATLQNMVGQMALFRKERKAAGLPPATEVPCFREIVCAPSRAAALEMAGALPCREVCGLYPLGAERHHAAGGQHGPVAGQAHCGPVHHRVARGVLRSSWTPCASKWASRTGCCARTGPACRSPPR